MIQPLLRIAVLAATVVSGVILSGLPASASPIAATLADECGLVRVTYTADGTASPYTISRNGTAVINGVTQSGSDSWNFAVFAQSGDVITLGGALSGTHTHVSPESPCSEPQVTVSFVDNCQDTSVVTFHNAGSAPATGFRIVHAGHPPIEIPAIAPGESAYEVTASEYETYTVAWGISSLGTVATHTYATPGDCGTGHLAPSFVDKCDGLDWSATNTAFGAQKVDLLKGTTVVDTRWIPVGTSAVFHTAAAEGDVFTLRLAGTDFRLGDGHTYHKPSCDPLPTTGAKVGLIAGAGAVLVVLGVGAFLLSRRRREVPA